MRIALHLTAFFLMLLAGCARARYVVEITPQGASFERRLTVWREKAGKPPTVEELPAEEVRRIADQYSAQSSVTPDGKRTFQGRFRGATPQDVGGAGRLQQFESPLGSSWIYIERFRGNDDVQGQLRERREAAGRVTDLLLGWFEQQLRDQPEAAAVRRFLDRDLRRDLGNLGVYAWTARAVAAGDGALELEFAYRAAQYLAERDYISAADVPAWYRALSQQDAPRLAALLQRTVIRKIGLPTDQSAPKSLEFLGDPERAAQSLKEYLRGTEEFQQQLADWRKQQATQPDSAGSEPDPLLLLGEPLARLFFDFSLNGDQLDVRLKLPVEPFDTNGRWDAGTGEVTWTRSLVNQPALPVLVYAAWSVPNRAVQTTHFGQVVLESEKLAEYAVWHEGLNECERAEWADLLADLRPGPDLTSALNAFRFSTDPPLDPQQESTPSLADRARELLLPPLSSD